LRGPRVPLGGYTFAAGNRARLKPPHEFDRKAWAGIEAARLSGANRSLQISLDLS
jgi:hypothetical protein